MADDENETNDGPLPKIIRMTTDGIYFSSKLDNAAEIDEDLANLDAIESLVSPYGKRLVDLYFRIIHPSYPILHKKVFMEKYSRTYRDLSPLGLISVYASALAWSSYSPHLAKFPDKKANALRNLAFEMLSRERHRPRISDLQSGLILSQVSHEDAWAMTGRMVSVAQNLGLHLDCSDWQLPRWEVGARKRLAWALFMQEKWGALIYGRPSHLNNDDWEVNPLEHSDFPETAQDDDDQEGSSDVESGKLLFINMVSLTQIVSDILQTFFNAKALRKTPGLTEILETVKPIQLRLKSWVSELPSGLSIDETRARKLSSNGSLYLAYYTAEITLHRAILRSHHSEALAPNLYHITREAAIMRFMSAVDFVKRIRPEHLQGFWYFSSRASFAIIGTFGCYLWMTASDDREREQLMTRLKEYRWTLRVSSNGSDLMKHAVAVLDAYLGSLERLQTENSLVFTPRFENSGSYEQENEPGTQDEYRDWMEVYQENFLGSDIWYASPLGGTD